jgi:hypothetical protein
MIDEEQTETLKSMQDEEFERLVDEMKKTRDSTKLARIIRDKGAPMEMTCVKAGHGILEETLNEKIEIQILNESTGITNVIKSSSQSDRVIKLVLKDGHYYNSNGRKVDFENLGKYDCLYAALSSECDLGLTAKEFRTKIANRIETKADLNEFVASGQHAEFLEQRFCGGVTAPQRRNKVVDVDQVSGSQRSSGDDPLDNRKPGSSQQQDTLGSSNPCGRSKCGMCIYMNEEVTSVRTPSGEIIPIIKNNTCETANSIYLFEYKQELESNGSPQVLARYVGFTKRKTKIRFGEHKSSVEELDGKSALSAFALANGIQDFSNFRITILFSSTRMNRKDFFDMEQHYIDKFQTLDPIKGGLNRMRSSKR